MSNPDAVVATILSNTYTLGDVFKRLAMLQDALAHSFYTDGHSGVPQTLRERYVAPDDNSAREAVLSWGEDVFAHFTAADLGKEIEAVKKSIGDLPTLTLYVATALPLHEIESIGAWCRSNVDPAALLDVRIDRSAAGGCILVWKNTLHDLSLQYFLRKHEKELSDLLHDKATISASA